MNNFEKMKNDIICLEQFLEGLKQDIDGAERIILDIKDSMNSVINQAQSVDEDEDEN